ncbi:chitinase [Timonella sp. A28]|uniref:chitinase n=1 Tax=Timonella sp. A28 TaxID=3442640 RepID=UPI003EC14174
MSVSFVVSAEQFDRIFPERNPFYTYEGLVEATSKYPEFARSGGDEIARREAAAFLANVSHETLQLKHVTEINTSLYHHYCDPSQPYGCPAGQSAYYGRGPIQLSWNFNYKAAGDALGFDLLNHPELVEQDPMIAWATGLWYWNTQVGPGTYTCHDAIVGDQGFRETIRTINGPLECEGGNPRQVASRIRLFTEYAEILGTTTGDRLSC